MIVVEQFRDEMRTGHVMIVTALTEQIEESRRHARVLHEDILDRLRLIGETLAAHTETLAAHTETLAAHTETLAVHGEMLAAHSQTLAAHTETLAAHSKTLSAIEQKLPIRRRKPRP